MSSSNSFSSEVLSHKAQKKAKGKGKQQPAVVITPHGNNEGETPDWAYQLPPGATLVDAGEDADEFDWDALEKDEDVEIWFMRVPEGVKAKHLENLKLDAPSGSTAMSARMGSLNRKSTIYDVWSLGENPDSVVSAEEVKSLACLVPRHKKRGKLYVAPKIPTRHVVLSARPPSPSLHSQTSAGEDMSWSRQQNPPRPSYPKELLKHRFVPFGSLVNASQPKTEEGMDVDEQPLTTQPKRAKVEKLEDDGTKPKKRKVEGERALRKTGKTHTVTA
ncbi:hypothetical protein BC835DRAFT_1278121 [Cytidiella melzeri]|nr:hypothetical protein BC835DRAFT_1278121 [Cytidiella melzeri]